MLMDALFEAGDLLPKAPPRLFNHDLPLIVDSFAGGGGASTGIEMALGRSPDIAINHNPVALAMHEANHPDTLHLSENIYHVDPLDYVAGRHIGLAWFSPDCKHFSKAKGGKPVERNIRDLAHIIPFWVERIQKSGGKIDVIIMENVEEFSTWGPLIRTEKGEVPDPDRKGETFQKWCRRLRRLGGKLEKRELRACDYGAPTIRKRLFVIIRFDGRPIVWPEPTHGHPEDADVYFGLKRPWRTAAEIIDWSLPCPSIFDTSEEIKDKHGLRAVRPLAKNTDARIARGFARYVLDAQDPFLVNLTHGGHSAVIAPVLTYAQQGGGCRPVDVPHHTICASAKDQNALIAPVLIQTGYGERRGQAPRSLDLRKPLGTAVAGGIKHAVAAAFVAQHNNDSRRTGGVNPGRRMDEPLSTITASGAQQGAIAAYCAKYFGTGDGAAYHGPLHTVTTKDRFGHLQAQIDAPPFTEAQAARARQVADFLRRHGFWDEREFVTLTIGGATYVVVDIGMRMLVPRELFCAQAFPETYKIEVGPDGARFTKSAQVSACGNSVSPVVAEALVRANCGHLAASAEPMMEAAE